MTEIELTDAQRQALQAEQGKPVDVVDPATRRHYVLLAREQYERVRTLLEPAGRLNRRRRPRRFHRGFCDPSRRSGATCRSCFATGETATGGRPTTATSGSAWPPTGQNSTGKSCGEGCRGTTTTWDASNHKTRRRGNPSK